MREASLTFDGVDEEAGMSPAQATRSTSGRVIPGADHKPDQSTVEFKPHHGAVHHA